MAEGLFRKITEEDESSFEVQSAGVATGGGQGPSKYTLDILKEEGIDLSSNKSQFLDRELIDWASHIFTMSASHLYTVEQMFPDAVEKTFLVTEFCDNELMASQDVPDPYGGNRNEYEHTRNLLNESLPSIVKFIKTSN